jgi:ABC-type lipoprotein release transport system permease subunit
MLLGVVFTIPAKGLSWPVIELISMTALVVVGMILSTMLSSQRLAKIKVVEALREL